jgi:hypothetical protein
VERHAPKVGKIHGEWQFVGDSDPSIDHRFDGVITKVTEVSGYVPKNIKADMVWASGVTNWTGGTLNSVNFANAAWSELTRSEFTVTASGRFEDKVVSVIAAPVDELSGYDDVLMELPAQNTAISAAASLALAVVGSLIAAAVEVPALASLAIGGIGIGDIAGAVDISSVVERLASHTEIRVPAVERRASEVVDSSTALTFNAIAYERLGRKRKVFDPTVYGRKVSEWWKDELNNGETRSNVLSGVRHVPWVNVGPVAVSTDVRWSGDHTARQTAISGTIVEQIFGGNTFPAQVPLTLQSAILDENNTSRAVTLVFMGDHAFAYSDGITWTVRDNPGDPLPLQAPGAFG